MLKCCLTTGLICLSIHLITVFLPLSPSHTLSALYDRPDPIDRWSEEKDQKKKQNKRVKQTNTLFSYLHCYVCPLFALLSLALCPSLSIKYTRARVGERAIVFVIVIVIVNLLFHRLRLFLSVSQLLSYLVVQFDNRRVSVILHGDTR